MDNSCPDPSIEHCLHVVNAVAVYKTVLDAYVIDIWDEWRNHQVLEKEVYYSYENYIPVGDYAIIIKYRRMTNGPEQYGTLWYDIKTKTIKDQR